MSVTSRSDILNQGISGAYSGSNQNLRTVIIVLAALSFSHALEILIMILVTFKKYRGLYFWSFVVATSSIIPYNLGFLFKFLDVANITYFSLTLITIGWYGMVSGQAVVLYSRLHLVLWEPRTRRRLLYMIIVNGVVFHLTTTVFTFGANISPSEHRFILGFKIIEKLQMTAFCLQEIILSCIYLREARRLLSQMRYLRSRQTIVQLGWLNILIIVMDLGMLGMEYANLYILEATVKPVVYSIKLKLEFVVLGHLIEAVRRNPRSLPLSSTGQESAAHAQQVTNRSETATAEAKTETVACTTHMERIGV